MSFKKPAVLIITLFYIKFTSAQMLLTAIGKTQQWQPGSAPQQQMFLTQNYQHLPPKQITQENLPSQFYNIPQNAPKTQYYNIPQNAPKTLTSVGSLPNGTPFQASAIAALLQNKANPAKSAAQIVNPVTSGISCSKCKELAKLLKNSALESLMKAATICSHKNDKNKRQIPSLNPAQSHMPTLFDRFLSH